MKITALLLTLVCLSTSVLAHEHGTIKIYNAKFLPNVFSKLTPGHLVLKDGASKTLLPSKNARVLNQNLEKTRDFFAQELGRKSWDNKGSDILAIINVNFFNLIDPHRTRQNAAWVETRLYFGSGSAQGLDNFEQALDVVAHEYTHAVIQTSANLIYEGQSGALNEHLADVFGSIINQVYNPQLTNPYQIGATVLNGKLAKAASSMRDMMNPALGLPSQPEHMNDLFNFRYFDFIYQCTPTDANDHCGVHYLSGIPNKMAAIVMSKIGPHEAAKLFYGVMTKRLHRTSNFADYRVALMQECEALATDTCSIVDDALTAVGI